MGFAAKASFALLIFGSGCAVGFVTGCALNLISSSSESAYCESVNGHYGGGKCFKNGKVVLMANKER